MIYKVNKINKNFVSEIIGPIDIILFFYPNHTYNTLPQPNQHLFRILIVFFFFFRFYFICSARFYPVWNGPFLSLFLVFLSLSVWIELIVTETENRKHYSKIIFKCVNSIVRLIFNIFKYVNGSVIVHKQYCYSDNSLLT